MKQIWVIGLVILMVLCVTGVSAQEYPVLKGYVTDNADLLTPIEEDALSQRIASIENDTSVEIAIVTVPSTNGESAAQYASKVGDKNGVGKSATDNGIVILVSMSNERNIFIATGSGIEGIITDLDAKSAYQSGKPYFSDTKKQYSIGFNVILDKLESKIRKDESATTAASNISSSDTSLKPELPVWVILTIGGVLILVFIVIVVAVEHTPSSSYTPSHESYSGGRRRKKDDDNDDDNNDAIAAIIAATAVTSSLSHSHHHDDDSSSSSDSDSGSSFSFGGGGFSGGGGGGGF
jgi:uncharacterized protein